MSSFVSAYGFSPVYHYQPPPAEVPVHPSVRQQVDLVLGPNATADQRKRAYQVVQAEVDRVGGVGDAGIVEEAIPEMAARLLRDNSIPVIARPEVIKAVDSQIGKNATADQRRTAYQTVQQYVEEVGGIGDAGIVEEALPWRTGQLLRERGIPARFSKEVVDAVDSQIGSQVTFAQRLRAYEIVQGYVDKVGGIGDQGIVQEALPARAGQLLREHKISTQILGLQPAMEVLDRDFTVFDTAYQGGDPGKADGKVSVKDLEAVRDGGDRYTPEQRSLAVFLLRSNVNRNYLDVAGGQGKVDGTIGRGDLTAARNAGESGSYYQGLLDTADGRGGRDKIIGGKDVDAALADPSVPEELKNTLRFLQLGSEGTQGLEGFTSGLTPSRLRAGSELYSSPQFTALPDADRRLVADTFRDSNGDARVSGEIRSLIDSPAFGAMTAEQKTAALTRIALVNTPEFRALPQADRDLVNRALTNAAPTDLRVATSIKSLLEDRQFASLSAAEKTAVLSQVSNYPNSRSIGNVQRLLQKDWFRGFNLEDKQRMLKMIAFLSQHNGDATVINNTLDKFLAPGAPYKMNFGTTGTAYGSALGSDFNLNRRYIPDGNGTVDVNNDDTLHMTTHTFAHEVNHLVNGDQVTQTFEYFNAEYRGFFVGFRAQHGRDPTVAEVLDRVRFMLTATNGAYDSIRAALANGGPESDRIVAFMNRLLGRTDVTAANAATLDPTNRNAAAIAPQGNLDNH